MKNQEISEKTLIGLGIPSIPKALVVGKSRMCGVSCNFDHRTTGSRGPNFVVHWLGNVYTFSLRLIYHISDEWNYCLS